MTEVMNNLSKNHLLSSTICVESIEYNISKPPDTQDTIDVWSSSFFLDDLTSASRGCMFYGRGLINKFESAFWKQSEEP